LSQHKTEAWAFIFGTNTKRKHTKMSIEEFGKQQQMWWHPLPPQVSGKREQYRTSGMAFGSTLRVSWALKTLRSARSSFKRNAEWEKKKDEGSAQDLRCAPVISSKCHSIACARKVTHEALHTVLSPSTGVTRQSTGTLTTH
jgi:primosomal replication protein N